ncbi:MAG: hypothetical protein KGO49_10730 [Gammaproteobacteria bacterium]|nr:hypothetical protein [Gammaproteobacteria bacterium]
MMRTYVDKDTFFTHTEETTLERERLWIKCQENKKPAPLCQFRGDIAGTTLSEYLEYETWTPEQAACLVSGIKPESFRYVAARPNDSTYHTGVSLSNMQLNGAEAFIPSISGSKVSVSYEGIFSFEKRLKVLKLWDARENSPAKVKPTDFVAWCKKQNIDTSWLAEVGKESLHDSQKNQEIPSYRAEVEFPPKDWKQQAREYGIEWMNAQRALGKTVGLDDISTAVRVHFIESGYKTDKGKLPSAGYIKRAALKGITGRKPNGQ